MRRLAALILGAVLLGFFSAASALDGFRKDFAEWDHDIVVVVTWYNKDIQWLTRIPEPITFAILVKGSNKSCATIPPEVKMRTDLCRELPNSDGREAHSMAYFLYTFYDTLPRLMVFAQDDCIVGHQCTILSLATMSFEEREELVESAERTPFADDNCLCDSITEPNFAECAPGTHEGNSPYPCYGVRWYAMVEIMRFLGVSDAREYRAVRWGGAALFAAPRAAIREQPRAVFKLLLALLNGVNDVARDASLPGDGADTQTASLRLRLISKNHTRDWQSSSLAHTFERLWFWILDPEGYEHTLAPGLERRKAIKAGKMERSVDVKYRFPWDQVQKELQEEQRVREKKAARAAARAAAGKPPLEEGEEDEEEEDGEGAVGGRRRAGARRRALGDAGGPPRGGGSATAALQLGGGVGGGGGGRF